MPTWVEVELGCDNNLQHRQHTLCDSRNQVNIAHNWAGCRRWKHWIEVIFFFAVPDKLFSIETVKQEAKAYCIFCLKLLYLERSQQISIFSHITNQCIIRPHWKYLTKLYQIYLPIRLLHIIFMWLVTIFNKISKNLGIFIVSLFWFTNCNGVFYF